MSEPCCDGVPTYLAGAYLDLWMALGYDPGLFDGYYERNGAADTWAALCHAVRVLTGARVCGKPVDRETCVLLEHDEGSPCWGASDVGTQEPLPQRSESAAASGEDRDR